MNEELTIPPLPAELRQDVIPFLKLPPEIRNMVYTELVSAGLLGWQGAVRRLSELQGLQSYEPGDYESEKHSTPTILLLNRQIHQEAMNFLYSSVFELQTAVGVTTLKNFFCKEMFQQLHYVTLTIDVEKTQRGYPKEAWAAGRGCRFLWHEMIIFLALVWHEKHNLQHLRVIVATTTLDSTLLESHPWSNPRQNAQLVKEYGNLIHPLTNLSGIEKVSIEGCSPHWYTSEWKKAMEMPPDAWRTRLQDYQMDFWKRVYPILPSVVEGWSRATGKESKSKM